MASLSLGSQPVLPPSGSEEQVGHAGGMTSDPLPRLRAEGRCCGPRRSGPVLCKEQAFSKNPLNE